MKPKTLKRAVTPKPKHKKKVNTPQAKTTAKVKQTNNLLERNQQDHQEVEKLQGQGGQETLLKTGVGDVNMLFLLRCHFTVNLSLENQNTF